MPSSDGGLRVASFRGQGRLTRAVAPGRDVGRRRGRLIGGAAALCLVASLAVAACGDATPSPSAGTTAGSGSQGPGATTPSSAASSPLPGASGGGTALGTAGQSAGASAGSRVTATLLSLRLPSPLSRAVVATAGGEVLVLGGVSPSGTTGAILRLDLATGSITQVGHLASAVHDASGAPVGQGWLVIGGGQTLASSVVQDVALSGAKVSAFVAGALPAARADGAAIAADGEVLVVGGGRGGVPDPAVLATRDGARFTVLARLPVAVRYPGVAEVGSRVYLFGGATTAGASNAIQALDPASGRVQVVARLPYALTQATAFTLGGRILIAGGMRAGRPSAAILSFDPATGRTAVVGRLPEAVADAGVAVVGDTAYLVGGETASAFLDKVIAVR